MAIFSRFKRPATEAKLPVLIDASTGPASQTATQEAAQIVARILTPEELRQELFAAAVAGDNQKLGVLGRQHREAIFEQRLIWNGIPATIRANPTLLRWYQEGLRAIVDCCAEWQNA